MNSKQVSAIRRFSNIVSDFVEHASFSITDLGDGSYIVFASNIGAPWYVKLEHASAIIGPRGGVIVKEANKHIRKWAH